MIAVKDVDGGAIVRLAIGTDDIGDQGRLGDPGRPTSTAATSNNTILLFFMSYSSETQMRFRFACLFSSANGLQQDEQPIHTAQRLCPRGHRMSLGQINFRENFRNSARTIP